jgi:hypothetical protein
MKIVEQGPSIDTHLGATVPAFLIDAVGARWDFNRKTGSTVYISALKPTECVIAPGLIYTRTSLEEAATR